MDDYLVLSRDPARLAETLDRVAAGLWRFFTPVAAAAWSSPAVASVSTLWRLRLSASR